MWCGDVSTRASAGSGSALRDLPFRPERGYGYVGGRAGRWIGAASRDGAAAARGGAAGWPLVVGDRAAPITWRQGDTKYVFRLPRGVYDVELAFVETEVDAPGLRVFDVLIEDEEALSRVDIHAAAGDFVEIVRVARARVADGWLDIRLEGLTPDFPPRVSRIRVTPAREPTDEPPVLPAPSLTGQALAMRNLIEITPPESAERIAGWSVLRAEDPEGPWSGWTVEPLAAPRFVDTRVESGRTYWYRARALGVSGGEGELSEACAVRAEPARLEGLRTFDLRFPPEDLSRIAALRAEPAAVPAELVFLGRVFPVDVALSTRPDRWLPRKSWIVDMSRDKFRVFQKRDELLLSAEAGDFTQIRERLTAVGGEALGLASPRVEPVALLVNGELVGARYDIERLGDKLRKRAGLDRIGLLARWTGDDHWRDDWSPRGERVGDGGEITALTRFIDELHRVDEGELEAFFAERFYLDRLIDRLAYAAVRGAVDVPFTARFSLRDSRNGKWELLQEEHRHRDWGIVDGSTEIHALAPQEVDRSLFHGACRVGEPTPDGWSALMTRLFSVPSLRSRYLARVEELLDGPLAPAQLVAWIESAQAPVRELLAGDPELWPYDGGDSLRAAPARILDGHARRVADLRDAIARERDRVPQPVVLEELDLAPLEGAPGVRIRNRSDRAVSLTPYRLSDGLDRTGRVIDADGVLPAGGALRVEVPVLGQGERLVSGGVLALWRREAGAPPSLADFVFYGHRTRGVRYARAVDGETLGPWRSRRDDADEELVAPPLDHRAFVEASSSGDLTLSLFLRVLPEGAGAIESVTLRYRPAETSDFRSVPLARDEAKRRWSVVLQSDPERPRTEYYFVARSRSGLEQVYPIGAPRKTLALPVLPDLVINEVCPRPGEGPDSPGEFIEIHNRGERSVSLEGLYLSDDREQPHKWRITEKLTVRPGGYALFYADGMDRGLHTSFKLSNSGEFIGLFTAPEEGGLRIDAVAYRGVPLGHSWGLRQDGTKSFRVWKDPTPGARNLPKIPEDLDTGPQDD